MKSIVITGLAKKFVFDTNDMINLVTKTNVTNEELTKEIDYLVQQITLFNRKADNEIEIAFLKVLIKSYKILLFLVKRMWFLTTDTNTLDDYNETIEIANFELKSFYETWKAFFKQYAYQFTSDLTETFEYLEKMLMTYYDMQVNDPEIEKVGKLSLSIDIFMPLKAVIELLKTHEEN